MPCRRHASSTAFASRYGTDLSSLIAGQYDGKLANGGETLRLVDFWNGTIAEFEYSDDWFRSTDGNGFSLTLAGPHLDPSTWGQPPSWRPSSAVGGSPGRDDDMN